MEQDEYKDLKCIYILILILVYIIIETHASNFQTEEAQDAHT